MVWSLIIVSKNKLQWSHLPSFSYSLLPIIKVERLSVEMLNSKQLEVLFGMFLVFGTL